MMSFGGVRIDAMPDAYPVPTAAMVTGLFGNALGLTRGETDRLQALQDSLGIASAVVAPGVRVVDFQTADLSKPHMQGPMWTASGRPFTREGQNVASKKQLQWRPYLADADLHTLVWSRGPSPWTLDEIAAHLIEPVRPLFIGRASCPPVEQLFQGFVEAPDLETALAEAVGADAADLFLPMEETGMGPDDRLAALYGRRNWRLNVHAGAETILVRTRRAP